jgi:predicted helicase
VYGFLHSPEYRKTFANDLKKMLPRLPLVEDVKDFWLFSKAGRELAELHIEYETVPAAPGVVVLYNTVGQEKINKAMQSGTIDYLNYRVEKMRFPQKGQKDRIIYNSQITITNIPEQAYEYVVNGKSAIEWIMERYQVTVHKESGIKNDPNDWGKEIGKPKYILDLLLSVINVSMQTVKIVEGLPKVKFE